MNTYKTPLTTKRAKEIAKANYGHYCIVTGLYKRDIIAMNERLDGCHIYPAGIPKYSLLKNEPLNIIPLLASRHSFGDNTFDYIRFYDTERKPHERIEWIVENVCPEFRQQLLKQIEDLEIIREQLI